MGNAGPITGVLTFFLYISFSILQYFIRLKRKKTIRERDEKNIKNWRTISTRSFPNIKCETREYGGEQIHLVEITGPIGLEERIPIFTETLKASQSSNYFSLVDNRRGHEDMLVICDLFINAGVRHLYTAIVTGNEGYEKINRLTTAVATVKNLDLENTSTPDYQEAEDFIISRIFETIAQK